jgi:hypothetical protein
MQIPDVEIYRSELEALVERFATKTVSLVSAEGVRSWAIANAYSVKGDPISAAFPPNRSHSFVIAIRRAIDERSIRSVVDGLAVTGFAKECKRLEGGALQFLSHTVLHELAHIENEWGQEFEAKCDHWAFARL